MTASPTYTVRTADFARDDATIFTIRRSVFVGETRRPGPVEVHSNAQVHAVEFYRKVGFDVHGKEFMDVGIPHRAMLLKLEQR